MQLDTLNLDFVFTQKIMCSSHKNFCQQVPNFDPKNRLISTTSNKHLQNLQKYFKIISNKIIVNYSPFRTIFAKKNAKIFKFNIAILK